MGRERSELTRKSEVKKPKKFFLLACEGKHTERRYFLGLSGYIKEKKLLEYLSVEIFKKSHHSISNPLSIFIELKEKIDSLGLEANEICLIIDRDADSFTEFQYLKVMEGCKENGYFMYLSNPNFEIWLLFHFIENITIYEKEDFLTKKGLIEEKLQERLKKLKFSRAKFFNKRIKFDHYKDKIKEAITLAKENEHDLNMLKDSLGTNVFQLVEKLFEV